MFTLYSFLKLFCSIDLMKSKDKNLVDIDQHTGVYLPDAKGFDKAVTIRSLFIHTSDTAETPVTTGTAETADITSVAEFVTGTETTSVTADTTGDSEAGGGKTVTFVICIAAAVALAPIWQYFSLKRKSNFM